MDSWGDWVYCIFYVQFIIHPLENYCYWQPLLCVCFCVLSSLSYSLISSESCWVPVEIQWSGCKRRQEQRCPFLAKVQWGIKARYEGTQNIWMCWFPLKFDCDREKTNADGLSSCLRFDTFSLLFLFINNNYIRHSQSSWSYDLYLLLMSLIGGSLFSYHPRYILEHPSIIIAAVSLYILKYGKLW